MSDDSDASATFNIPNLNWYQSEKPFTYKKDCNDSFQKWLYRREAGFNSSGKQTNQMLYASMRFSTASFLGVGSRQAVFNINFSPDGKYMIASSENHGLYFYDPLTYKLWQTKERAHENCVNGVKFISERTFASYGDDRHVNLWDVRNVNTPLASLLAHENWVKNVEYSEKDKLLISSGFDGYVIGWDLDNAYSVQPTHKKIFHSHGVMRMVLTPDCEKMIISTSSGYIMIFSRLDLKHLFIDVYGFKPSMYRMMQYSDTVIPKAAHYTPLFSPTRQRNRVEFITDFPGDDDNELISSLAVHPDGLCLLSRNLTVDETTEWTCIHDLAEVQCENPPTSVERGQIKPECSDGLCECYTSAVPPELPREDYSDIWEALMMVQGTQRTVSAGFSIMRSSSGFPLREIDSRVRLGERISAFEVGEVDQGDQDEDEEEEEEEEESSAGPSTAAPAAAAAASTSSLEPMAQLAPSSASNSVDVINYSRTAEMEDNVLLLGEGSRDMVIAFVPRNTTNISQMGPVALNKKKGNHKIAQNHKRLTHFVREDTSSRGFIKEVCWSMDGRVVSSPFYQGLRLFAFNQDLSGYDNGAEVKNGELSVIAYYKEHKNAVLCTKFSPTHYLLASGCKGGCINWYTPHL